VTNYLARQVIEAAGRLPDAAKTNFPAKQQTPQNYFLDFNWNSEIEIA
jgi:hypothetical protein